MKKGRFLVYTILLLSLSAAFLAAEESEYFVKTMPVSKIYNHYLGYRVVYVKSDLSLGEFYVPVRWFTEAGSKGQRKTAWQARGTSIRGATQARYSSRKS